MTGIVFNLSNIDSANVLVIFEREESGRSFCMLNSQGEIAELIEDGWRLVGMVQKPNDKPLKQGWREPNIKGVDMHRRLLIRALPKYLREKLRKDHGRPEDGQNTYRRSVYMYNLNAKLGKREGMSKACENVVDEEWDIPLESNCNCFCD